MELRIDPEFQGKIPPLTDAEFRQLEENILEEGEVREPLIVWNGIIVDGHNRWKIIQMHPDIPYKTKKMNFADRWEAFDWMYRNQLGRRNLTEEQSRYLLGKLYEARKHTSAGAPIGNTNASKQLAESRPIKRHTDGVSLIIANEQGVGKTQVKDSYQFAKGIDAIREVDNEMADSILTGEKKVTKHEIQSIGKAQPEDRTEMIQCVKEGKPYIPHTKPVIVRRSQEEIQKEKEEMKAISEVASELFDTEQEAEYTIDSLLSDIEINSAPFIRLLSQMITANKELCKENKATVIRQIHKNTVIKIMEIEKEIEGYE